MLDHVETIVETLLLGALYVAALLVILWMAGAIFYDIARATALGYLLVLSWLAACLATFAYASSHWHALSLLVIIFVLFLWWWLAQKPSHHRNWNPNFAQLPHIEIDGDAVTIHNVRNTEYRSLHDFTAHYETRIYHLSNLRGVDAAVTYWGSPWMSHPMLIFDFGRDGRVCFSIEIRYQHGQRYGLLPSIYRQSEIIYLVTDERDSILKRTKYEQNHDVYLYQLDATLEEFQKVFLEYVVRTNELYQQPAWYNGFTSNCTTSIYRQRGQHVDWDWRWLFNGQIDQMIYEHGRLKSDLPFEQLKQQSYLNEIANNAPLETFGDQIRQQLPAYAKEAIF